MEAQSEPAEIGVHDFMTHEVVHADLGTTTLRVRARPRRAAHRLPWVVEVSHADAHCACTLRVHMRAPLRMVRCSLAALYL